MAIFYSYPMLSEFNSKKIKFWSFVSMVLLVFVHSYNLNISYLQPWTIPGEPLTITTFTQYWLANGIFRFRIPMLFIISGYLFAMHDYRPYKQRMGKRVRTLLVPYMFWSAAGLLLTFVLELFPLTRHIVEASGMMNIDPQRHLLHQFRWYEVLGSWIVSHSSYQMWFIRVLLVYNLLYPVLRWFVVDKVARFIFFPIAIFYWLSSGGIFFIEGEGLLFFSLGIWMQKNHFDIDTPRRWLSVGVWGTVFVVTSVVKTWAAFAVPFTPLEPWLVLLHKLVILSGLITAWYGGNALVTTFMSNRWFVKLSAFSFMIYAMHAPLVVYASKALFIHLPHFAGFRLIVFFALPIVLLAGVILTASLLRRYLPGLYKLTTGGRGF